MDTNTAVVNEAEIEELMFTNEAELSKFLEEHVDWDKLRCNFKQSEPTEKTPNPFPRVSATIIDTDSPTLIIGGERYKGSRFQLQLNFHEVRPYDAPAPVKAKKAGVASARALTLAQVKARYAR